MRSYEGRPLIFIDQLSFCSILGAKRDDGLSQHVSEVVAVFGGVVGYPPHLAVDLTEQF